MMNWFTFKSVNIVFIGLLVTIIFVDFYWGVHFIFYFLTTSFYFILVGIGSSRISSGFHLNAICTGNTALKHIAITFDDGPNERITPEVLKVLSEYNVKATFFCIGKRIKGNETLLVRMKREGHIVGNHTFSHGFFFDFYLPFTVRKELEITKEAIYKIINKTPKFFRPPYGVTNPAIAKAVRQTGFEVIGWNVRSLDTVIKDEQKIVKRITENLKGGDIVLFHDTNPRVVNVLKAFLIHTTQAGFKIVGLDELINKSAYA